MGGTNDICKNRIMARYCDCFTLGVGCGKEALWELKSGCNGWLFLYFFCGDPVSAWHMPHIRHRYYSYNNLEWRDKYILLGALI